MISENSWIPWDERNDIPKLAFIITDEVIPMPPIPVEYVEDFEKEIETNRLWHTNDVTDVHCYPEKSVFMIVNYNALPKEVRMYYADYFDFNNEYIDKMVKSMLLHSKQTPNLLRGESIDDYRKGLKDLLFHNYQYLCNIQKRLERFARAEWQNNQWVKSKTDSVSVIPVAGVPAAPAVSDTPAAPASAPADETSNGRTVIDEKLKFAIGEFIKENPNCSNNAIARKFKLGKGTISSNPDLKAFIERCRQLNIQSMENNPNFDNDPFSNGRGRRNE